VPHVSTHLVTAAVLEKKLVLYSIKVQQNVYHNDYIVHTLSEMCVQCVRCSGSRHIIDDVSIHRCCDQWSAVVVHTTQYKRLLQLINGVKILPW